MDFSVERIIKNLQKRKHCAVICITWDDMDKPIDTAYVDAFISPTEAIIAMQIIAEMNKQIERIAETFVDNIGIKGLEN